MSVPSNWYDWNTTGWNGPANWDTLGYYFNNITWTCYWVASHECDWWLNTTIALYILKQKITELGEPPEITMSSILNAMMSASFDELQTFIGIVDAYRVALWNAPFNAEYYAALARGFQKWP